MSDRNNIKLFGQVESEAMMAEIGQSNPSDEIVIDPEAAERLYSMWSGKELDFDNLQPCPADIFHNNTIPMRDCMIRVVETDEDIVLPNRTIHIRNDVEIVRVVIGEKNSYIVLEASTNSKRYFTAMFKLNMVDDQNFVTISDEFDFVSYANNGNRDIFIRWMMDDNPITPSETNYEVLRQRVQYALSVWYGIQISLLNPKLKTIVGKGIKAKYSGECGGSKKSLDSKGKRKAHYVKRHVIGSTDIDNVMSEHGFTRKTMAWYVIGHWRSYKDGKKVFIQPYWKGPLRTTQKNLDDIRERVV